MGSDSDWPIMKPAVELLKEFGVEVDVIVASAHRTPAKLHEYAENARENGVGVIIAAAGAAAHLAGVIASYTTLPVIGVPIIFGAGDAAVAKQLEGYREKLREGVAKKAARVASQVNQ